MAMTTAHISRRATILLCRSMSKFVDGSFAAASLGVGDPTLIHTERVRERTVEICARVHSVSRKLRRRVQFYLPCYHMSCDHRPIVQRQSSCGIRGKDLRWGKTVPASQPGQRSSLWLTSHSSAPTTTMRVLAAALDRPYRRSCRSALKPLWIISGTWRLRFKVKFDIPGHHHSGARE